MKAIATLLALALANIAVAAGSSAHNPWHYKGIYLGARMSRDQIMRQLGVTKYRNNPDTNPWQGCDKKARGDCAFNRYGLGSAEWVEFNIGPLCEDSGIEGPGGFDCLDPWMASASSNNHGITEVEVFARRDGTVDAIDIFFDSGLATDFFEVAHRQFYGAGFWQSDSKCDGPMVIGGNTSPQHPRSNSPQVIVDRICESLTTRRYRAYMTNYDEIVAHVTPPAYRGFLEIKLLDQEL